MRRAKSAFVLAVLIAPAAAGCDQDSIAPGGLEGIVEGAQGKQDGFAIEAGLGDSLDLSVVAKPAGAEVEPEHARAVVFTVEAGQTFAVVMRGAAVGGFEPWVQLHTAAGEIATSDRKQVVVHAANEDDAVVIAHADRRAQYTAIAADRDLAVSADFQLDLIAIDGPAPKVALERTDPATVEWLDEVRRFDGLITNYDAVSEDGLGSLVAHDDSPLVDRNKIDAANATRQSYFEVLAELHGAPPDELRAVIGPLWAALATDTHARR